MYVSLMSERSRSFWKSAVAVAASFALRACERASDMRGGALVLQGGGGGGGGGGRVARRTPNSPSVAQACRVSATRRVGDGAHKKTKEKTSHLALFFHKRSSNNHSVSLARAKLVKILVNGTQPGSLPGGRAGRRAGGRSHVPPENGSLRMRPVAFNARARSQAPSLSDPTTPQNCHRTSNF
ncbi:unnamed protein product [Sphagnum jensenii]|uniref:Secreted protein n=1 Tax=Sphagnum jensenii TaxID=128206 RepID=A0ABP1C036_9BRYO